MNMIQNFNLFNLAFEFYWVSPHVYPAFCPVKLSCFLTVLHLCCFIHATWLLAVKFLSKFWILCFVFMFWCKLIWLNCIVIVFLQRQSGNLCKWLPSTIHLGVLLNLHFYADIYDSSETWLCRSEQNIEASNWWCICVWHWLV